MPRHCKTRVSGQACTDVHTHVLHEVNFELMPLFDSIVADITSGGK